MIHLYKLAMGVRTRRPLDKLVLTVIAEEAALIAGDQITVGRIAKRAGMSAPTVRRALKRLEADGFIERDK